MNERQQELLKMLLKERYPLNIRALSKRLRCSERTVRNDLDFLDALLEMQELRIERVPGVGVLMKGSETQRKIFIEKINQMKIKVDEENKNRREQILFNLMMREEPVTLDVLSDQFFESKKVVREDLKILDKELSKMGFKLHIQTRVGVYIEGNEKKKRDFLAHFLNVSTHQEGEQALIQFFKTTSIVKVNHILARHAPNLLQEEGNKHQLSSLTIHILFMIARIEEDASIQLREQDKELLNHCQTALILSKQITDSLSESFNIYFPDDEVAYLALRIANYQIEHGAAEASLKEQLDWHIDLIVERLIKNVENILELSFQGDVILKNNLREHLRSSLARINSGFHIQNPLKDSIKKTYLHLFLIIQTILDEFVEKYGWRFPEEELAYLTVHFQAAIERASHNKKKYRSVLICDYGVGVSTFLKTKIEHHFPQCNIVSVLSSEMYQNKGCDCDFIFNTTSHVKKQNNEIKISPLFSEADQLAIQDFLRDFKPQKIKKNFAIHRYTHSFLIYPQLSFRNKEEALRTLCQKIENRGYVDESYVETVLRREEYASTQIGSSIAIPHGQSQHIKESALLIATLKEPMEWGYGPVQIIFLLALKKEDLGKEETRNLFSLLYELMNNEDKRKELLLQTTPLDIMRILSYYEE